MAPLPDDFAERRAKVRKQLRFAGLVWAVVAVFLVLFWMFGGFQNIGLNGAGAAALVLGILGTSALAIVLMGLLFYSDLSNADEGAYHYRITPPPSDDQEPKP